MPPCVRRRAHPSRPQGKEELDALEQLARDRSTLEFGSVMADINSSAAEFEASLAADRTAAEVPASP